MPARGACRCALLLTTTAVFAAEPLPVYSEHQDLSYYLDANGTRHPIQTPGDWEIRRKQILGHIQSVMGLLPDRTKLAPLDVQQVDEVKVGSQVENSATGLQAGGQRGRQTAVVEGSIRVPPVDCSSEV